MNKKALIICLMLAVAMVFGGCGQQSTSGDTASAIDTDCFTQVSTIQALMQGDYYGSMPVGDVLNYGDIGLGTFAAVDGEMIVLDGECYQAIWDGSVKVADKETLVPFAIITTLDADKTVDLANIASIGELKDELNKQIGEMGANAFYACRIDGVFNTMHVRSEYSQKEPYKPLNEAMETDQTEFEYENVSGSLVCVYCPDYAEGLNATGWHIHFISDDRTTGGHVLDLSIDTAQMILDKTNNFEMYLPESDYFNNLQLTEVSKEALNKVEKGDE